MEKIYLRAPGSENHDGPFSPEQLRELANSDLINPETLYCKDEDGEYEPLSEDKELCEQVFATPEDAAPEDPTPENAAPEERKPGLKLKKRESNSPKEEAETKPSPQPTITSSTLAKEYEVGSSESDHWDGPFSVDQLRDLVDSGVVTAASLIRANGESESITLSENQHLWDKVKPDVKPALKLRSQVEKKEEKSAQETPETKTKKDKTKGEVAPVSPYDESGDINQMLAAAEGKTEQTKHTQRLKKSRSRAVALLLPTIVFSLLIFISAMVQPCWRDIYEMFKSGNYSFSIIKENWFLLFAIADLILMIGIGLGQTGLFSLLRLRCGIGIGVFLFLFYSRQEWLAAGAFSLIQAGLIGATLCIRFSTTLFFSILSLGSGAAMIWLVWFKGIAF